MISVTEQYSASEALVLPVEAQAARLAPTVRAWVNAAVMPLSLKLPEGFMPSYCKNNWPGCTPTYLATDCEECSRVWPSPIVAIISGGANGNSSRNRHTPLKHSGSSRRAHFSSKYLHESGGRARSQSYITSSSPPH